MYYCRRYAKKETAFLFGLLSLHLHGCVRPVVSGNTHINMERYIYFILGT